MIPSAMCFNERNNEQIFKSASKLYLNRGRNESGQNRSVIEIYSAGSADTVDREAEIEIACFIPVGN